MSLFDLYVKDFGTPANEYSFGIEVEFLASNDYIRHIKSRFTSVLGIDGADYNNLGEYRSPVFHSKYSFTAFRDSVDFTDEVFKQLTAQNFLYALCPVIEQVGTMGIHFSLGGKFLKSYSDILERCNKVQSQLKYRYIDYQKFAFREQSSYRGDFTYGNPIKIKSYQDAIYRGNGYDLSFETRRFLGSIGAVVEYRFFPSCRVDSIIPYLYYILFDGVFPNNCVVPYYKDNKYYR